MNTSAQKSKNLVPVLYLDEKNFLSKLQKSHFKKFRLSFYLTSSTKELESMIMSQEFKAILINYNELSSKILAICQIIRKFSKIPICISGVLIPQTIKQSLLHLVELISFFDQPSPQSELADHLHKITQENQRESDRAHIDNNNITCLLKTKSSEISLNLINLSTKGVFFHTKEALNEGQIISLIFQISSDPSFKVTGKILHADINLNSYRAVFIHLTSNSQNKLNSFIESLESYELKKMFYS